MNIGFQTAVDFLKNKKSLGEIKDDANLSTKISDDQYNALVRQFKGDKDIKNEAEKLAKKGKEKKTEKKSPKAEDLVTKVQKYTPLGKIDLGSVGKPAKPSSDASETKSTNEVAAESLKEEKKVATAETKLQETAKPTQPVAEDNNGARAEKAQQQAAPMNVAADNEKKENKQDRAREEKRNEQKDTHAGQNNNNVDNNANRNRQQNGKTQQVGQENKQPKTAQEERSAENKIFTLKSEKKLAPKVNVLGKIDLDALNQSTRPKKKSKEERKREREEKAMHNGEKKKRVRINNERVDIEAASQQGGNGGKKKKNKGGNGNNGTNNQQGGNNNQQGGGKNRNKQKNRPQKPLEVNEEDVARQVKETLARLTNKNQNKKGAKYRREKREAVQERLNEEMREEQAESKTLKLTEFVTVSELATMMNVPVNKVIGTCMSVGIMVSINQRLDAETINLVAEEFGFNTEYVSAEVSEAVSEEEDDENDLIPRAPIVTVMGHVDHGKTSLLDHIRNSNVIAGEAGGITQHIGAYNVTLGDGRKITFLDTPGHEAFTAMRARGAQVTDIAIIIIAADDSVMPTTREAIAHAQAANVPMVFAINKIDKPGANADKIREDLANMNLLVEEWGGKYQCQEISAKKGLGVQELLEKVLLEAEMLDLKANPNRKATGSIIESSLDKGRGYVSTVLVSNGTLKVGDIVIAGTSHGRIKAMFNERNQRIEKASPAEPAIILGLNGAPTAGDSFHVMDTEQEAKEIANKREQLQREQGLRTQNHSRRHQPPHRTRIVQGTQPHCQGRHRRKYRGSQRLVHQDVNGEDTGQRHTQGCRPDFGERRAARSGVKLHHRGIPGASFVAGTQARRQGGS